jgi:hypothetical protein
MLSQGVEWAGELGSPHACRRLPSLFPPRLPSLLATRLPGLVPAASSSCLPLPLPLPAAHVIQPCVEASTA